MYPGPAKVIHHPKADADGSEIARIYGSEIEFPGRNCKRWMKELYEIGDSGVGKVMRFACLLLLIGDSGVGKSCLLLRFADGN